MMATGRLPPSTYTASGRRIVKQLLNGTVLIFGPDGVKVVKPVPGDDGWPIIAAELRRLAESVKNEAVGRVIGSLADGGYIVLGPHGGPVGPWNPEQVKLAEEAVTGIARGIRTLQMLGACNGKLKME